MQTSPPPQEELDAWPLAHRPGFANPQSAGGGGGELLDEATPFPSSRRYRKERTAASMRKSYAPFRNASACCASLPTQANDPEKHLGQNKLTDDLRGPSLPRTIQTP